jgi:hypothetical protein
MYRRNWTAALLQVLTPICYRQEEFRSTPRSSVSNPRNGKAVPGFSTASTPGKVCDRASTLETTEFVAGCCKLQLPNL